MLKWSELVALSGVAQGTANAALHVWFEAPVHTLKT